MDIATWLRGLGLERYAQTFQDNAIEADLLPSLTAEDLKELGVIALGHRRRLLDAIAARASNPQAETPSPSLGEAEGERRQVTAQFAPAAAGQERDRTPGRRGCPARCAHCVLRRKRMTEIGDR